MAFFAFPTALALSIALNKKSDDTFDFTHRYTVGTATQYVQAMGGANDPNPITTDLTILVTSVTPTGALLNLTARVNVSAAPGSQSISSKVGVTGFPDAGGLNDAGQPFIFMGIAGATTGEKVKVGDELKVHWQNEKKDTTIDETGKVLAADKDAKILTVDWSATMTVTYAEGATFHFKSVYSTDDFSLVSSEGTMRVQNVDFSMKFSRKAKP